MTTPPACIATKQIIIDQRYPMLFKLVKIDEHMDDLFHDRVFQFSHSFDPIFSKIGTFPVYEGEKTVMRAGEETWTDEIKTAEAISGITPEQCTSFSISDFHRMAKEIGSQLLEQKTKALFETMKKATEATGNVIDTKGQPISHDYIFQMIEMMDMDFNPQGEPEWPTMVVSPTLGERMEQLSREANDDPKIKKRYEELIIRKKEEFRAREADRKLVG
jgi:hypothetical protein